MKRNSVATHPGRVGLVDLVEHDDGGAAVIKHQPPEVCSGVGQWVRRHHEGGRTKKTVHQSGVDVVAAVYIRGDQEGQSSVRRQDVHAPVLLSVSGQQRNTALLHVQVRCHRVQRLTFGKQTHENKAKNRRKADEVKWKGMLVENW